MKKRLIYAAVLVSLFTNIYSMKESEAHKSNRKRDRDELESNISGIANKRFNASWLLNIPNELKLHILEQSIKNIIDNSDIFEHSKNVKKFILNTSLTHSEFRNLESDLIKFAAKYAKEYFAPEYIDQRPEQIDKKLKNIITNINIYQPSKELEAELAKLIIMGANINVIEMAKLNVSKKLIELLVLMKNSAAVNIQDNYGNGALMYAIIYNRLDISQLLINAGIDVNMKSNVNGTALIWAVENGSKDIAKLLIVTGADINLQDYRGKTALIFAANDGHRDVVESLIAAGADINMQDKWFKTALNRATCNGHKDIVELLINTGANVNEQDQNGDTALV